ncbi:leukocyte elastase inhibitor-like [Pelodiscus sinensis]|uniref:leukocyte elastase inhibitor-like n=1 Tax=Pelodiscus sinensis TaxID=13735 RepID=UPI003F6C8A43
MNSVSEAIAIFSLDFFKVLNKDFPSENIIYSPLSISGAMSMVLLGARGNSASQMQKVLHFTENENPGTDPGNQCDTPGGIHSQFHDIFSEINKPTLSYELAVANRLYGEKTFQFLQQYLSCIQELYQAELKPVDFQHAAEEIRKQINEWVETFTKGKIKDLFGRGSLSGDTKLVLVNAVYFKGQWAEEFKKENTKETPFHINETTSKPVQMMNGRGKYNIATIEEYDCQVLELPYKDSELSMYILLPKDHMGLTELEMKLTYEKLTSWISPGHMEKAEVMVSLPKFKIERDALLNKYLEALGMTDVFRPNEADLSGMAKQGDLSVSQVVHKAYIDVNEQGTEAAAATGISVGVTSISTLVTFVADHPFLFFIRHQKTKCILFYGRVSSLP